MSFKNRKCIQDAYKDRQLRTEALITYDDIFKGGLFATEVIVDSAKKSELISLINSTFLNDNWLDKFEIRTDEIDFPKIGQLLTRGALTGDMAETIIADYAEQQATLSEVIESIENQNEKMQIEWGKLINTIESNPDDISTSSPTIIQANRALDNLLTAALSTSPANVFKEPKNLLGCVNVKYNGEEYSSIHTLDYTTFKPLSKDQIKKLAGHIIDTIDDFTYLGEKVCEGPKPITQSSLNGVTNSDLWWHAVVSLHNFRTVTRHEDYLARLPPELLKYDGESASVFQTYHSTIFHLLRLHLK